MHQNQSPLKKILGKLIEDVEEQILCVVRRDVLCPNLDDAWSFGFNGSKDCPEVEVMGDGGKVHVEQNLHAVMIGTSISSTRHAAYARA